MAEQSTPKEIQLAAKRNTLARLKESADIAIAQNRTFGNIVTLEDLEPVKKVAPKRVETKEVKTKK